MKILENSAIELARKETNNGSIVLGLWKNGTEYATWYEHEGHTYTGHYFSVLLAAEEDFKIRM